ncbi:hypothetical protein [Nakamurella lactea]|uniref:hypothetical protein n=1 Tax=Nakamurella lactea TaxID=459515 RepID=UPI0012B6417E|nr:hypothetical protein [Nakamurella lactea]
MPVIRYRKPNAKSWATVAQIRANLAAAEAAAKANASVAVPQVRTTPPATEATTEAEQKPATPKENTHGTSR